jgi:hypothetical protein
MKNPNSINKHAPHLALVFLISMACTCFGQAAPPLPAEQAKVIPPPTLGPTPPMVKTHTLTIPDPGICSIQWVLPGGAGYTGELPKTGETPFEWTPHPTARRYELVVTQPDGTTIPYKSDGVTKSLYMENYKQAGQYLVTLSALDENNQILCSINLTFTKPAVDIKTGNQGDNDDGHKNPTIDIPLVDPPR